MCYWVLFSPRAKKRKVLMSLKPLKPKHRQYPSSTAVSQVTALCDWAENTSVSVYVCLCVISECDWAAACAPSVRAHAYDLSLFFVSAMQSRREKRSILTSLFPGRLILFFQIRALTGFWYCILMWFRSGLSFFVMVFTIWNRKEWISGRCSTYGWSQTTWCSGYKTSLD